MKKPSVTSLVDLLAKPALITWANKQGLKGIDIGFVRDRAMSAGSSMHAQIEDGAFDDPEHAANFAKFAAGKEFLATEKDIETDWFVGRYDVLLGYQGQRWLCDYKKSRRHRLYFEHKIQLVAYGMAEPVDRFAVIATPDFAFLPLEIDAEQRAKLERVIICLSQIYTLRAEIEGEESERKRKSWKRRGAYSGDAMPKQEQELARAAGLVAGPVLLLHPARTNSGAVGMSEGRKPLVRAMYGCGGDPIDDDLVEGVDTMTRPPNDRGQGRKPLSSAEKTVSKTFRMTEAQAAKVERLGGAQWVRERIDKAREK